MCSRNVKISDTQKGTSELSPSNLIYENQMWNTCQLHGSKQLQVVKSHYLWQDDRAQEGTNTRFGKTPPAHRSNQTQLLRNSIARAELASLASRAASSQALFPQVLGQAASDCGPHFGFILQNKFMGSVRKNLLLVVFFFFLTVVRLSNSLTDSELAPCLQSLRTPALNHS